MYVRAVGLGSARRRALILSTAPCTRDFLEKLSAQTGIPVKNILFFSTQTHAVPFNSIALEEREKQSADVLEASEASTRFLHARALEAAAWNDFDGSGAMVGVSGDIGGAVSRLPEQAHPGSGALWSSGAAGDLTLMGVGAELYSSLGRAMLEAAAENTVPVTHHASTLRRRTVRLAERRESG